MNELKDELNAALIYDWHVIPITENHHKWLLEWYRSGDDDRFVFVFVSPRGRRYAYYTKGGRVIDTDVSGTDNGAKLDAVLRLTPRHIQYRLYVLLGAIGDSDRDSNVL